MTLPISDKFVELAPEEVINKAISAQREGKCVILTDEKRSHIPLKSLLRERSHPEKTKLEKISQGTAFISKDETSEDVAEIITNNGLDFVTIKEDGEIIGVVLEEDLAKELSSHESIADKKLEEVMTPGPFCVSEDDDISSARNILFEQNIERLPVVDEDGKVSGIVEIEDILKTFRPDESPRRGGKAGGHYSEEDEDVLVIDIMQKNFVTGNPNDKIKDSFKDFKNHIIVTENGEPDGIITSKDILENFPIPKQEGVHVNIMGLQEVDDFVKTKVHKEIENSVQKLGKMINILNFFVHVKFHNQEGGKRKYTTRVRLSTDQGLFVAKDWEWDLIQATSGALNALEKEVIKHIEKQRDRERRPSPEDSQDTV